ncbi:glycosyltransferase family 4 protein [Puniceicoccus vermicola]|uniref:Glycosyltransferase family 4 protein n=1 Tax=Puniceicoccus vermicola TaxID=388746 RepID=A0A7X1AV52_9BACT|nr:glycosyltransferase family 1 protein [Puniceicoccus vermicola]MBC2600449.1 glycosyltransferase family 4 protein [Puniceicoccus vermicola]
MDKIYIDATATANTLHHTGIQRVVRSLILYGAVRMEEWIPVIWSGEGFRAPTRGERRRLIDVFSRGLHRKRGISRFLDRWEKKWEIDFLHEPEGTLLLIPEIPSGDRLRFLDDLAATGARQMEMAAVCHDLLSWSSPQWTPDSRREGFTDYLRFLGLVERVICPSQATASEWQRFQREEGVAGAEPEVLPWPPGGGRSHPARQERPLEILCVGTLEARKNHAALLEAAELLWTEGVEFSLTLVGRRRAKNENEIPDRIAELRSKGRSVDWLGQVSDAELEELYAKAAFTVFPSLAEGYGLPVAESLVRGRPCVCSGEGAVGEIAAGGGCRTVRVEDPGQLSAGIRDLLTEPELRERLAREGLARSWPTWDEWMSQLAAEEPDASEGTA